MRAPWPRHMYKIASVASPVGTAEESMLNELGSTIFSVDYLVVVKEVLENAESIPGPTLLVA